jgi:hypothetical protein
LPRNQRASAAPDWPSADFTLEATAPTTAAASNPRRGIERWFVISITPEIRKTVKRRFSCYLEAVVETHPWPAEILHSCKYVCDLHLPSPNMEPASQDSDYWRARIATAVRC